MSSKRKGLGRGLDALLTPASELEATASSTDAELKNIPVDLLQRGKYQPRRDMRPESLEELAESIRAQGVVQPIVARSIGEGRYEIVAGERRWRAAQIAGLDAIPAIVRNIPDEAAVAMALIENIQREDLNPLEEARALQRLIDEFGMKHSQVAEAVGRSRSAVSNLIRLLELPDSVKTLLEKRELEMGHARALLSLPKKKQKEVAKTVARRGLSVRETEALVRRMQTGDGKKAEAAPRRADPDIVRLEKDLSGKLAAPVKIKHRNGKGELVIRYTSLDELDGILAHIK